MNDPEKAKYLEENLAPFRIVQKIRLMDVWAL